MSIDIMNTRILYVCARRRNQSMDAIASQVPDIPRYDAEATVVRLDEDGLLLADIFKRELMDGVVIAVNGVRGLTRRGALLLHGSV